MQQIFYAKIPSLPVKPAEKELVKAMQNKAAERCFILLCCREEWKGSGLRNPEEE